MTPVEQERRRRVVITWWAFCYEVKDDPRVTDNEYDHMARAVDLSVDCGDGDIEEWFKTNFLPHSGIWVLNHPELDRLEKRYKEMVR